MSPNNDALLSAAVTAFLGWPTAKMPLSDENAVADLAKAHSVDATPLLARVYDAITASDDLTISDLSTHSTDGGATADPQLFRVLTRIRPRRGRGR